MVIDIVTIQLDGKGGLEKVITKIFQGLTARGHKVRLFLNKHPIYSEWLSTVGEVYYYETKYGDELLGLYREYSESLVKYGMPDVILATHSPSQCFICKTAVSILHFPEPPIISWVHFDTNFFGNCFAFSCGDAHMAVSSELGRQIKEVVKDKSEVYVVGNPIHIVTNEDIPQSTERMKFVYVGRISNAQKRLDTLIYALKALNFSWQLDVYGSGPDVNPLKMFAEGLEISDHIIWHGWCEQPFQEIDSATALISPSDQEGFGLVIAEALMRGIPVIACKSPGANDLVEEGVNGWLYDIKDLSQLIKIMSWIHDGKLKLPDPKICKQSVRKYEEEYVIDHIEQIIRQTLEKKKENNKCLKSSSDTDLM